MRIDRIKFATALAKRDMKIIELAELTGVSRNTISAIKGGKSCSKQTAQALANVLGKEIFSNHS